MADEGELLEPSEQAVAQTEKTRLLHLPAVVLVEERELIHQDGKIHRFQNGTKS